MTSPIRQVLTLNLQKAWEIATGPGKQIPMNLFMSYMSGNSLQLIPITMTLMLFTGPLKAVFSVNNAFQGLESEKTKQDILLAKLTFVFLQVVVMAIGVYKLNSMGLIPNRRGDWLSWELPTQVCDSIKCHSGYLLTTTLVFRKRYLCIV